MKDCSSRLLKKGRRTSGVYFQCSVVIPSANKYFSKIFAVHICMPYIRSCIFYFPQHDFLIHQIRFSTAHHIFQTGIVFRAHLKKLKEVGVQSCQSRSGYSKKKKKKERNLNRNYLKNYRCSQSGKVACFIFLGKNNSLIITSTSVVHCLVIC